jgi:hypothetical protein
MVLGRNRSGINSGFLKVKSGFLGIFIWLAASAPVSAYTVSFIVIETGLGQDSPATESSNLWENGLMDTFFDAGHIVSNAHTLRMMNRETIKDFPEEAQADFDEARQGGVEFFVMVLLDYQGSNTVSASPGTAAKPRQVFLKVFSVDPYQKIYEQGYSGPVRDELAQAKSAARSIFPYLRDRG